MEKCEKKPHCYTVNMPQAAEELAIKEREALEVIKEDLCQWLAELLHIDVTTATFWDALDTGVLLCKLAKLIQQKAKVKKGEVNLAIPNSDVKVNEKATPESFAARDNASNFISWCRQLGVEEAVIYESEGLVLHKDEKRVILCLLDVARFAERVGISPPQLVRMEKEIDNKSLEKPSHKGPKRSLQEKVMVKLSSCKCPRNPLQVLSSNESGTFVISGGTIRGEKTLYARVSFDHD